MKKKDKFNLLVDSTRQYSHFRDEISLSANERLPFSCFLINEAADGETEIIKNWSGTKNEILM